MFALSNKFPSRSRCASTDSSRPEVVVVFKHVTTGNNPPSESGAFLKCQATEIEVISLYPHHVHDHASQRHTNKGVRKSTQFKIHPRTFTSSFKTVNHKGLPFLDQQQGCTHLWKRLDMRMLFFGHHLKSPAWSIPRFPLSGAITLSTGMMNRHGITPSIRYPPATLWAIADYAGY